MRSVRVRGFEGGGCRRAANRIRADLPFKRADFASGAASFSMGLFCRSIGRRETAKRRGFEAILNGGGHTVRATNRSAARRRGGSNAAGFIYLFRGFCLCDARNHISKRRANAGYLDIA